MKLSVGLDSAGFVAFTISAEDQNDRSFLATFVDQISGPDSNKRGRKIWMHS